MNSINPFESPAQVSVLSDKELTNDPLTQPINHKTFLIRWVVLVGVNSIVPLLFARELATPNCFPAIISSMISVTIAGAIFFTKFPRWQRPIVAGSYLIAASQLIPVVQLACGAVAFILCRSLGIDDAYDLLDEVQIIESPWMAASVTVVTSSLLAIAAILSGSAINALLRVFRPKR